MKKILKQGMEIIVDDDIFLILKKYKLYLCNSFPNKNWYPVVYNKKIKIPLGRFILKPPNNKLIDHINRNTLDNRRKNLRICNYLENSRNRSKSINNKSGYKGVIKIGNKWFANIVNKYKHYSLGYFQTPIEAAKAYDKKAKKLHGEFACLNFKNK